MWFVKILLFPLKVVFFLLAWILKGVLYFLSTILMLLCGIISSIQWLIGGILALSAISGTVLMIVRIRSGDMELGEGILIIAMTWLFAMSLVVLFHLCYFIAEKMQDLGDFLTDVTLEFFGF